MRYKLCGLLSVMVLTLAPSCALFERPLPEALPPLADMEEPLELMPEPQDEEARQALPLGGFTGAYVGTGGSTLDELVEGSEGVTVERIVENSPAAIAGIEVGDLIIEAALPGDDEPRELRFPSEWRKIELESKSGDTINVLLDRAGEDKEVVIKVVKRLATPDREEAERFREEEKVGVVLRTATEVEARAAGLGPGAGGVVVGLSKGSPWRAAGLRFQDLLTSIDDEPVAHPRMVLDAIEAADSGDKLTIGIWREGAPISIKAPVSARDSELAEVSIPPFYSYENDRDRSETSILLGLFGYESTPAAWRARLLWFITFGGGDSDELEEVEVETVEEPAQP